MSDLSDGHDEAGLLEFHRVAKEGDEAACQVLLTAGADPNLKSGELVRDGDLRRDWYWDPGSTPLLLALEHGHPGVAKLLLSAGADVSGSDVTAWGAVHAAVAGDLPDLLLPLVRAGAELNLFCSRRSFDEELGWFFMNTPLHLSALRNNLVAAQRLIDTGADLSSAWEDRRTPLFYAAARGHTEMVQILCRSGADPNLREHRYAHSYFLDMTPLHYAARNGYRETYEALVQLGAEPRARESNEGMTAPEMLAEAEQAGTGQGDRTSL